MLGEYEPSVVVVLREDYWLILGVEVAAQLHYTELLVTVF